MTAVGTAVLMAVAPARSSGQESHLVVVTGLSGAPVYQERFQAWALALLDAARQSGVPGANLTWLAEKPDADPRIDGTSNRETVAAVLSELARTAGPHDRIFVVLIGHGSERGGESRINLPGPDLSAADFAVFLKALGDRETVFVNTASASGEFVQALSGPKRTVVTATRSGREGNEAIFGGFFTEAFGSEDADTDKDGRISVLEAFEYARQSVARSYEEDDLLLTEHALLDDNGDGQGSEEPNPEAGDGARASRLFLATPAVAARAASGAEGAPADTVLARLYREKAGLEDRIAELRGLRDQMEKEKYESQLEELVVELTMKTREIEKREGGGGS